MISGYYDIKIHFSGFPVKNDLIDDGTDQDAFFLVRHVWIPQQIIDGPDLTEDFFPRDGGKGIFLFFFFCHFFELFLQLAALLPEAEAVLFIFLKSIDSIFVSVFYTLFTGFNPLDFLFRASSLLSSFAAAGRL